MTFSNNQRVTTATSFGTNQNDMPTSSNFKQYKLKSKFAPTSPKNLQNQSLSQTTANFFDDYSQNKKVNSLNPTIYMNRRVISKKVNYRSGNRNNQNEVDLLEDLTDATLRFVPIYEQTIKKVQNQVTNPNINTDANIFDEHTHNSINKINNAEILRQSPVREDLIQKRDLMQNSRELSVQRFSNMISPKINMTFNKDPLSAKNINNHTLLKDMQNLFPLEVTEKLGSIQIQRYLDSRQNQSPTQSLSALNQRNPFNKFSPAQTPSINMMVGSPKQWLSKTDNAHIELKDRFYDKHQELKKKLQYQIDYQDSKRNRFMLREVLHKGIWKYKYEDFKKPDQIMNNRKVTKVEMFQKLFEDALGQENKQLLEQEDELFSIQ
eukprot:403361304